MVGISIARKTRSGTGVGPGICRKWRPAVRDEFFGMELPLRRCACRHQGRMRYAVKPIWDASGKQGMTAQMTPGLERRLRAEVSGDVLFDRFDRGRYATDASHYQMMPLGVVVPRTIADAERALAVARQEGVSVLPRGGGTSQSGQSINTSLVVDCSK